MRVVFVDCVMIRKDGWSGLGVCIGWWLGLALVFREYKGGWSRGLDGR